MLSALFSWVKGRDPNELALRRAARTAIVMSGLFAFCMKVIDNAEIATFAAFGSIALLMLVDLSGPMRSRIQAEIWLSLTGAVLVCLGTLTSQTLWLSVLSMALVAIAVLFFGVVSSVLASATTSLLLVFILSTAVAGPPSAIPDRLAGWGIASLASLVALWLLWPAPNRNPLRLSGALACRALSARLNADVAHWRDDGTLSDAAYEEAIKSADRATEGLHHTFLSAQWRPTGLSVSSRATVRLVDEILWLDTLVDQAARPTAQSTSHEHDCQIRSSCAAVLQEGADVLEKPTDSPERLERAREALTLALKELARSATARAPFVSIGDTSASSDEASQKPARSTEITRFVDSLEPSFRAQEIGFVASLIGANIDLVSAAERRRWLDTLVGLVPGDVSSRLGAARERAAAHLNRHSVWLHNSVRGAIGLSIAVFIAEKTGVQHAFWVILGALSVLRSNAVNTGANALRALLGTAVGFVIGAALLVAVGTNVTVLWILLPVAILLAGFAPTAISFAAGQAGFTLALVILWNILQPIGWRVGLYRIEDIAIGCAVSVGVGLFFWPRGASAALGVTFREAFETSAAYLVAAVTPGAHHRSQESRSPSSPEMERAASAAASRRLDDAFRTYLGERGSKPIPLADVTSLVRGVVSLRQTAEAVLDLWHEGDEISDNRRSRERSELSEEARRIGRWYDDLGAALTGDRAVPDPLVESPAFDELIVSAVDDELRASNADTSSAVRLIWTKDFLGVTRRLEETLVGPAHAAIRRAVGGSTVRSDAATT